MKAGNVGLTLLTLCLIAWAAGDAVITPQSAASPKPQAAGYGAEAITIPQMLSYQGKLTDTLGQPVPNGSYPMMFLLYNVPSGGSPFWSETQSVTTKSGLFSVFLGSVTPIGSLPDAGAVYLGMTVSGGPELTPRVRIVSAAYAYKADTANYALAGGTPENAWTRGTPDSVLYTAHQLGVARGGADNMLYNAERFTHVNLGVACTTGTSGQYSVYSTVGGGWRNVAGLNTSTVAGGACNRADSAQAFIGGGYMNRAYGTLAVVCGGNSDTAAYAAFVGGGLSNRARGPYSVVTGGNNNVATADNATVGGGWGNLAQGAFSVLSGGYWNATGQFYAAVGGGAQNYAGSQYSVVPGGCADSAINDYAFATNNHSVAAHSNSAAFNGQVTTASNQTRVGVLSKASGTFTIDHPLDPDGKILNHYFIEGPEMLNIYRGSAVLDAKGRADVQLPEYFDALNRDPQVVLTGIGSSDVYLAEEVSGNRFTVGGKPGIKVNWIATGERKDVSAEVTRRMMPVEQPKTGALAGRMLDDDFLSGCMSQLVREGKAQGIDFRTAAGRQQYEEMKRHLLESQAEDGR
jgi:hypothetical protein